MNNTNNLIIKNGSYSNIFRCLLMINAILSICKICVLVKINANIKIIVLINVIF